MTLRRSLASALLALALTGTLSAQSALKPPGGSSTFGAAQDQPFNSGAIFAPETVVPPSVAPAQFLAPAPGGAIGAGADGGLLLPPPPPPPIWSGSAETGLNGASGNADLLNFRAGLNAQRKVSDNIFTTDFLYTYTQANKVTTIQQALLNARDEVLFDGSPWSLFGSMNLEYDELRAYKFRVGLYGGVGRVLLDTETTAFKVRAGVGAVREVGSGGLADRWVPEMVFGYDFKYRLSERASFLSILDFYPRIDDWSRYRVRARLGYEHVLDPANGLVMRAGIQNRYDSDPGNARRNDVTYFMTLGVKF